MFSALSCFYPAWLKRLPLMQLDQTEVVFICLLCQATLPGVPPDWQAENHADMLKRAFENY